MRFHCAPSEDFLIASVYRELITFISLNKKLNHRRSHIETTAEVMLGNMISTLCNTNIISFKIRNNQKARIRMLKLLIKCPTYLWKPCTTTPLSEDFCFVQSNSTSVNASVFLLTHDEGNSWEKNTSNALKQQYLDPIWVKSRERERTFYWSWVHE